MKVRLALVLLCSALAQMVCTQVLAQTPVWTQFPNSPVGSGNFRNDDLIFVDLTNGWSARGKDGIYRTTNGGQSWTLVFTNGVTTPGLTNHFRAIGFASTTRGWAGNLGPGSYDGAVNHTNLLWETFDGGLTWSAVPDLKNPPGKTNGFCALHVLDAQHIYGAGRVRGPAVFYKTENGGASWSMTNLTDAGVMGGLMDVYFMNTNLGFIVGMNTNSFFSPPYYGSIARTTNGGASWQVMATTPVASSYFWKMSWPSTNIGYVSLQQNAGYSAFVFYKTTNGGQTWVSNGIPLSMLGTSSFELQGIGFVSTNEGWLGGGSLTAPNNFIHTTDGGLTWTAMGYVNANNLNRFRFVSPTLGYVSGIKLHVYHIPLAATISPGTTNAAAGTSVTLAATVYGTPPIQFHWRQNGTNLVGGTTNGYTITNVIAGSAGNYDLVVSDFSGALTSAVTTVLVSGIALAPSITVQPWNTVANQGSNATFAVTASGTAPLSYQWFFNAAVIANGTNASLTLTNVQAPNVGNYFVVITNSAGSVTSSVAALSLGFADDFDSYGLPITVTNAATTNGYKIFFDAASGPVDFKAIFGFDYSTVAFPTNIVSAPHSAGGSTRGLYLTVNKDANGQLSAVNLYPVAQSSSGNFALKFDLWMNWATLGSSSEQALFGINHSGNVTNRLGLAPSDGLFYAVNADGNISAANATLRDYNVLRGGTNAAPILMLTNNATFGPTPLLAPQFDNLNPGLAALFPARTVGSVTTPAGSPGLGWVSVEVRQVNNLITCLLNDVALAQYTNTSAYTNGTIMLGYYDGFVSIGDSNSFAIFDNVRLENITLAPVVLLSPQVGGGNFSFSFMTEAYETYSVEWTTNVTASVWQSYTNLVGDGSLNTVQVPLLNSTPQYFRVSRP